MTEPDVALTDYALALECAILAAWLLRARWRDRSLRLLWSGLFGVIALSSLTGGTVHGFFVEPGPAQRLLWTITMTALGVASLLMWLTGARLHCTASVGRWVRLAALAQFMAYVAVVLLVSADFVVAIAVYLPATVFLLATLVLEYRRTLHRRLAWGIAGLLLTFVAAGVQQSGLTVHPVYFNHNALYHLIQGVALYLIFLGATAGLAAS